MLKNIPMFLECECLAERSWQTQATWLGFATHGAARIVVACAVASAAGQHSTHPGWLRLPGRLHCRVFLSRTRLTLLYGRLPAIWRCKGKACFQEHPVTLWKCFHCVLSLPFVWMWSEISTPRHNEHSVVSTIDPRHPQLSKIESQWSKIESQWIEPTNHPRTIGHKVNSKSNSDSAFICPLSSIFVIGFGMMIYSPTVCLRVVIDVDIRHGGVFCGTSSICSQMSGTPNEWNHLVITKFDSPRPPFSKTCKTVRCLPCGPSKRPIFII